MRRLKVLRTLDGPKGINSYSYKQPILGLEGGLPFDPFLHPNLVVSSPKISLEENLEPM